MSNRIPRRVRIAAVAVAATGLLAALAVVSVIAAAAAVVVAGAVYVAGARRGAVAVLCALSLAGVIGLRVDAFDRPAGVSHSRAQAH